MTEDATSYSSRVSARTHPLLNVNLRFAKTYYWLIAVSFLDVVMTHVILRRGGSELNPLAAQVITFGGLPGMLTYKMLLLICLVLLCELLALSRLRFASIVTIGVTCLWSLPPLWAIAQLCVL